MKKLVLVCVILFLCNSVYAKDFAKRWPTDTALEVVTPTSGDAAYFKLDQSTPQTVSGGAPIFADNIVIGDNTSGVFGITFDEDTANGHFNFDGTRFTIDNTIDILGNYVVRWKDPTDTNTYAYIQGNGSNFIFSAVNVPLQIQYGVAGGAVWLSLDTAGNAIFNYDAGNCDFTINKQTAGQAYVYDAGADTHTFSGALFSIGNSNASAGVFAIYEDTDDGSNNATFTVPALAADTDYTLPPDDGDPGEQLTTNGAGVLTWEAAGAGAGGDAVTVNGTAVDTTADFDDGDIVWTLTDGGAGGPDTITGTLAADSVHDTMIDWGSGANQVDLADIPGGTAGANAFDFGGATSVEIPNGAADVVLSSAGQVYLNTTDEQLCFHSAADGEISGEAAISLIRHISLSFDPSGYYDQETTYRAIPVMYVGDDYPEGFTLTEWRVTYVGGNPTTELDADLCFDTTPDFNPAAGMTVMDVLDTTNGSSTADTGFDSATAPNGSQMYIRLGADPTDANVIVAVDIWGYAEED